MKSKSCPFSDIFSFKCVYHEHGFCIDFDIGPRNSDAWCYAIIKCANAILTNKCSGLARLVESQIDLPPEFNKAVDRILDDMIANR